MVVQYLIALVVVAAIVAIVLSTSRGDEAPDWGDTLGPVLGVLAILVAIWLLAGRLRRRR